MPYFQFSPLASPHEASFLVAEKFESLVNCWDDLTRVRGVGPITKRTAVLGYGYGYNAMATTIRTGELG